MVLNHGLPVLVPLKTAPLLVRSLVLLLRATFELRETRVWRFQQE